MFESFLKCFNQSDKINVCSKKSKLKYLIDSYNFLFISNCIEDNQIEIINKNLDISDFVIIDQYSEINQTNGVFIIGFQNTLLIIKQSSKSILESVFIKKKELVIYFLNDAKDVFNKHINIQNRQIECHQIKYFNTDIITFNNQIYLMKNNYKFLHLIFEQIKSCITGYLILKSYLKSNQKQKNPDFSVEKQPKEVSWSDDDYVILRFYGTATKVLIIYHIELNELFAIKKQDLGDYKEFEREYDNYSQIKYPLLPNFYGKMINIEKFLIIQYINGQTLSNIKNMHLEEKDKYVIIFEILLIFNYLHQNEFVYLDLKPDNVIIDDDKNAFLIDFDRMLKISDNSEHTLDIQDIYSSPEARIGQINYKNDIYSIGRMIYFIMNEKIPSKNSLAFFQNSKISLIYKQCTNDDVNKRPSISELTLEFYVFFLYDLDKLFLYKYLNAYYFLKLYENDFNKVEKYFILSADLNDEKSQNFLGFNYLKQDINKALHYLSHSAKQNYPPALYNLGVIYTDNKYVNQDISKAIKYLTLASNQNFPPAQSYLGRIYYKGIYIKQDINKAIQYFSQAADQNYPESLHFLGTIYYDGLYVTQNINKAIQYFSQAADQNYAPSQQNLGAIYYMGKYIQRNINKAIHYYTLAVKNNIPQSLNELGMIYLEGKFITRDIDKAIHYFLLSAKKKIIHGLSYNLV